MDNEKVARELIKLAKELVSGKRRQYKVLPSRLGEKVIGPRTKAVYQDIYEFIKNEIPNIMPSFQHGYDLAMKGKMDLLGAIRNGSRLYPEFKKYLSKIEQANKQDERGALDAVASELSKYGKIERSNFEEIRLVVGDFTFEIYNPLNTYMKKPIRLQSYQDGEFLRRGKVNSLRQIFTAIERTIWVMPILVNSSIDEELLKMAKQLVAKRYLVPSDLDGERPENIAKQFSRKVSRAFGKLADRRRSWYDNEDEVREAVLDVTKEVMDKELSGLDDWIAESRKNDSLIEDVAYEIQLDVNDEYDFE